MKRNFDEMNGSSKVKQISPSKYWCWTLNNFKEEHVNVILEKSDNCVFQEEIGESGTHHLQGYSEWKCKVRPISRIMIREIHWEKRKGSRDQAIDYCTDRRKRMENGRVWCKNINIPKPLIDPLEGKVLYDFQEEIEIMVKEIPHDRHIYWYWEGDGGKGKTSFVKHMCIKDKSIIMVSGKAADIKCAISKMVENKNPPTIVFFHYTRDNEEYISYEAIEAIKDAIFFNGKYESAMTIYNIPHVICFANFSPNIEKMSYDRWVIKKI